jgi:Lantibiotic biosynthesis dehydratase C-term
MTVDISRWISLRLVHHGNDKERLALRVIEALEPLLETGVLRGYFVQRHWWRGPHLRFNLRFASPQAFDDWRCHLERVAQTALEAYPSVRPLSEAEYLHRYAPVAALELSDESLTPLEADNSWRWMAFSMREAMYGSRELTVLSRQLLTDTQALFDGLLRRTVSDRSARLFSLVELMLHHVAAFDDPANAALSFRSHAEAYFHLADDDGALRQRFSKLHEAHAEAFAATYARALRGQGAAWLESWTAAVRSLQRTATTAFATGGSRLPSRDDFLQMQRHLPEGVEPASSVHDLGAGHQALLDPNSALSHELARPEVQAMRLVTNLLYERFVSLGVTVRERFLLCTLAAMTVERHHDGTPWIPAPKLEAVMHP